LLSHKPISIDEIVLARQRLAGKILRTPLVRLYMEDTSAEIYLKLENLQPIGSFKLRGAGNAMLQIDREELKNGVWTASAGNMAQAVAWFARQMDVACLVIAPEDAAPTKLAAIRRLGASIRQVPFAQYQQIEKDHACEGVSGRLIHPFGDDAVMAGNGTLALEILEDLPDVDAILVPYGGGGLSCGIASAVRARQPQTRVYACEVETAAPLAGSLRAGKMVDVPYAASFVNGIGAPFVFPEMWSLASKLLEGSLVVLLEQVAGAIRLMAERSHVIVEGAGAVPVAAALAGLAGRGKLVCIVSGGNIDLEVFTKILRNQAA
jgi:threonine dehydratase